MSITIRDRLEYLVWVGFSASVGGALISALGTTMLVSSPIWLPLTALHLYRSQNDVTKGTGHNSV
jgi:hypothetical protein